MSAIKTLVETGFGLARNVFSTVQVRHSGNVYVGIDGTLEFMGQPGSMAAMEGADGSVRLLIAELKNPIPKENDVIECKNESDSEWSEYRIITPREDQPRATVQLDYGERHG